MYVFASAVNEVESLHHTANELNRQLRLCVYTCTCHYGVYNAHVEYMKYL